MRRLAVLLLGLASGGAQNSSLHERVCGRLALLEAALPTQACADTHERLAYCLHDHQQLLGLWGPTGVISDPEVRKCRTRSLGRSLCTLARDMITPVMIHSTVSEGHSSSIWRTHMKELTRHIQTDADCEQYEDYDTLRWKPEIFNWPDRSRELHASDIPRLTRMALTDSFAVATFKQTMCDLSYGPQSVRVRQAEDCKFRAVHSQPVLHWWNFYYSTGLLPANISILLEFGGGTGEQTSVLSSLNFTGVHLIYDYPQMLQHVRYWTRYSGIPSYFLGKEIPIAFAQQNMHLMQSKVLLTDGLSSDPPLLDQLLPSFHLESTDKSSVFLGTWSLTEAGTDIRQKFLPIVLQFSHVLLAWQTIPFKGAASDPDMLQFYYALRSTHTICAWKIPTYSFDAYVFAVRKGQGEARCIANLVGCTIHSILQHVSTCTAGDQGVIHP